MSNNNNLALVILSGWLKYRVDDLLLMISFAVLLYMRSLQV